MQNGVIEKTDSSYFELGQTKWRKRFKRKLKLFTYISIQLPHNEAKWKAQQTITKLVKSEVNMHKSREVKNINLSLSEWKYAGADHDGITKYQWKK